jgi:hypothetical protein
MAAVAGLEGGRVAPGDATRPSTGTDSSSPLASSNTSIQSKISNSKRELDEHTQWLEENAPPHVVQLFKAFKERELEIHQAAAQAPQDATQQLQVLQDGVQRTIELLKTQTVPPPAPANPKQAYIQSWANVVAAAPSSTPTPQSTLTSSLAVTTHLITRRTDEQGPLQGLQTTQITDKFKAVVPGAVAARVLPSGDIRVTLENPTQKEQAIRAQGRLKEQLGVKIIREEFPVEVLGVPTSFTVPTERQEDSTPAIQAIKTSTAGRVPGLEITRLHWIHGKRSLQPKRKDGPVPKAASLILWLPREALQREVCLKGVVIDCTLYDCRLYHTGLQLNHCFNCQKWGHRQGACRSRPTCGFCAKGHNTRECPDQKDPTKAKCANCGKHGHPAWRKEKCEVYRKAVRDRELLRTTLLQVQQSWVERALNPSPPISIEPPSTAGSTASSLKRSATSANLSPTQAASGLRKRGPGKPPLGSLYGATPSASQPAIQFNRTIDLDMADSPPQSLSQPTPHAG